uniref:Annexin n=1 Tax=Arcella intermedia TaxID=1963864 RepID=A0A6B2LCH3_9EUKA
MGTDEDEVIKILGHRSKEQITKIDHEYRVQSSGGNSLYHALKHELSGSFGDLAISLATPTVELKRMHLQAAVEGLGTRESTLIDVFTQSSNHEIQEIVKDAQLYQHILSDISGDFKAAILGVIKGERPSSDISDDEAAKLAGEFYKAGEGKIGTDENKYIKILTSHSLAAVKRIDKHYQAKHKHSLEKAIKSETSGDLQDILVALTRTPAEYFASRLHRAISGLGTNERIVNFVFGLLSKHELHEAGKIYKAKYKESLEDAIKGDTSFNYKKLLIELLK